MGKVRPGFSQAHTLPELPWTSACAVEPELLGVK